MNYERMELLRIFIRDNPDKMNMLRWYHPAENGRPPCGCIAGWTMVLFGHHDENVDIWKLDTKQTKRMLDLPDEKLFRIMDWPRELREDYFAAVANGDRRRRARAIMKALVSYGSSGGWASQEQQEVAA